MRLDIIIGPIVVVAWLVVVPGVLLSALALLRAQRRRLVAEAAALAVPEHDAAREAEARAFAASVATAMTLGRRVRHEVRPELESAMQARTRAAARDPRRWLDHQLMLNSFFQLMVGFLLVSQIVIACVAAVLKLVFGV